MKTQNKKKNISLRIASGMAVAALLSTCVVSATFAKYTTSTSATDTARVAYWGFGEDSEITFKLFDHKDANIVSSNGDQVIAPGSSASTQFAFVYNKNATKNIEAPEVAYEFKVTTAVDGSYTSLDNNTNFNWTLQAEGAAAADEYGTVAKLFAAIKALSVNGDKGKSYAAGELPALVKTEYKVGWEWKFDDDNNTGSNDSADTEMGNATDLANIEITIKISATQLD